MPYSRQVAVCPPGPASGGLFICEYLLRTERGSAAGHAHLNVPSPLRLPSTQSPLYTELSAYTIVPLPCCAPRTRVSCRAAHERRQAALRVVARQAAARSQGRLRHPHIPPPAFLCVAGAIKGAKERRGKRASKRASTQHPHSVAVVRMLPKKGSTRCAQYAWREARKGAVRTSVLDKADQSTMNLDNGCQKKDRHCHARAPALAPSPSPRGYEHARWA